MCIRDSTHTAPVDGVSEKDLLESAALAESFSSHPISKSLREACPDLDARRASDAQEIAGHGVKTQVDGHTAVSYTHLDVYKRQEHDIHSTADGSVPALRAALDALRPGGVLAAVLYSGKVIGDAEKQAALAFFRTLPLTKYTVLVCEFANWADTAPLPCFVIKK